MTELDKLREDFTTAALATREAFEHCAVHIFSVDDLVGSKRAAYDASFEEHQAYKAYKEELRNTDA
jgi:hypothetical protein